MKRSLDRKDSGLLRAAGTKEERESCPVFWSVYDIITRRDYTGYSDVDLLIWHRDRLIEHLQKIALGQRPPSSYADPNKDIGKIWEEHKDWKVHARKSRAAPSGGITSST